jgi:uncharacterized protein with FMN-binding domain
MKARSSKVALFLIIGILLAVGVITAILRFGHDREQALRSGPITTIKGPVVRTLFSNVQVAAVMQNGQLIDVLPIIMPNIDDRSHNLTALAEPILRREAIAANSANIQAVSGASYTSSAYVRSLQGALAQVRK